MQACWYTFILISWPMHEFTESFADIYEMNSRMPWADKKIVKFYLWVALAFFLLGTLHLWDTYPGRFSTVIINNLWAASYVTVINFILFEVSVPFVLRRRKLLILNIIAGLLLLFIHAMLYSYGSYAWRELGKAVGLFTVLKKYDSLDQLLQSHMGYSMGSVFLFGIVRHIYNYNKLRQSAKQLQIEKQEAELNYLKSQTNPHFLFNTLNNIYALARDKNDLAPESILRLSKILRFMLYETGGAYIAIGQELKIMNDYIALERLRYDDSLHIRFNHDIEDMKQAIPPLLLMPLVENAFKHGVSETRGTPFVEIHLSVNRRQLKFTVRNSTEPHNGEGEIRENIGLSNLRRQLELLYSDHELTVVQDRNEFSSILKINLASHV
jgi:two-component system LytT family sensor kinase